MFAYLSIFFCETGIIIVFIKVWYLWKLQSKCLHISEEFVSWQMFFFSQQAAKKIWFSIALCEKLLLLITAKVSIEVSVLLDLVKITLTDA